MFNLQNKKRSNYSADDLAKLDASLSDYWDKSRALESETVNDFEKHLWLANGAAATVSIGFIQAKTMVTLWQYRGRLGVRFRDSVASYLEIRVSVEFLTGPTSVSRRQVTLRC